jgi:hypothetical protein
MNRFGYFRAERYVYDPQRGAVESARIRLANRHNVWKANYKRDSDGAFALDARGQRIPIPVAEREVKTVPYYLSTSFPTDDPLMVEAAKDTLKQWNDAAKEALAVATEREIAQTPDVFVLCNNPVQADDPEACGDEGFSPRVGDLRYSVLHWVEVEQIEGPLGYGPVAADPETGEILSARAYVYGAGIQTYASYGLDIIRFTNGDITPDDLQDADHVRAQVQARRQDSIDLDKLAPEVKRAPIPRGGALRPEVKARRDVARQQPKAAYDPQTSRAKLEKAREAGLQGGMANGELERALGARLGLPSDELSPDQRDRYHPSRWLSPTHLKEQRRRHLKAMSRGVDGRDMLDPNVLGIARSYAGRTDYDQIWRELRALIFKSTAIHEVGHTMGLRHNFQGTFDSLNFFDPYWDARQENLIEPQTMGDLYELTSLTEAQTNARMREFQYSSIMDYGVGFNTDIQGLGRYDKAAWTYAYSAGAAASDDPACDKPGQVKDGDRCLAVAPGYVQVFQKRAGELGAAADILLATNEYGQPFNDPTTPNVPYLERWHYTTFMRSFPALEDAFDREWMRMDQVQREAAKGGEGVPVRVPYLFCSDEWVGALTSCQVYDLGADMFEQTRTIVNDYRSYYYFVNFKRDRLVWDPIDVLFRYFYYTFLPLSDLYQGWYFAPDGYDEVQDTYTSWGLSMGFNLLSEAISTPPYGSFCTGSDGDLFHLEDEPGRGAASTLEYYLSTYCDPEGPRYEIAQGEGRRRFTVYDAASGYHFDTRPREAGHYWATVAAFWALVDPEAFVLGTEADAGTFAISYYDIFSDEIDALVAGVISEDYGSYSPLLEDTSGPEADVHRGKLHYRIPSPVYDPSTGTLFNPETGESTAAAMGPSQATTALCEPCAANAECNGFTGSLGGVYCQPIDDSGQGYCLQDCSDDPDLCPAGTACDEVGNCAPEDGDCAPLVEPCDAQHPHGTCDGGQTCDQGACVAPWRVVQSDSTFSLFDDMVFYGMLYTTSNYSTRYNDRINVFKLGTNEAIEPGPGFVTMSFTDPISGDAYGAVAEDCGDGSGETVQGGSTGLCGACVNHADCAGYNGQTGGTFCQPVESEDDPVWFCLQDCTDDPDLCPDGTTCDEVGNCVPRDLTCEDKELVCAQDAPLGTCEEGSTCVEGACVTPQQPSPRCRFGLTQEQTNHRMILKGQRLVEAYNEALTAYWEDDGSNAEREERLFRRFSRARFELEAHVERINTIRAVFAIFGKVY